MIFKILSKAVLIFILTAFVGADQNAVKSLLNLTKTNYNVNNYPFESHHNKPAKFILADTGECFEDISRLCPNINDLRFRENNFAVLMCVQDSPEFSDISSNCNNLLWSLKLNLTQTKFFLSIAEQMCGDHVFQVPQCSKHYKEAILDHKAPELSADIGLLLSCLLEFKEDLLNSLTHDSSKKGVAGCRNFITNLEKLIFSDYRLIYNFQSSCLADILSHKCGRIGTSPNQLSDIHSQGATIECLERNQLTSPLSKRCRKAMYRIAEMQGEDFQLDRPLFFSCRKDKEKFCAQILPGQGRVYECLFDHLHHPEMSEKCREHIELRENMIGSDYKVSYGLAQACAKHVRQHCGPTQLSAYGLSAGVGEEVDKIYGLTVIMVCLEKLVDTGVELGATCRSEMLEHRRMLSADYALSPGVMIYCRNEISTYCPGRQKDGSTLKCLMDKATPQFVENVEKSPKSADASEVNIGPDCWKELWGLQEAVLPAEDYHADQWLAKDCTRPIDKYCSDARSSEMLDCLLAGLNQLDAREVYGRSCAGRVLQLQFFVARRFDLDHETHRICQVDAARWCGYQSANHQGTADRRSADLNAVMACLFAETFVERRRISESCADHVIKTLEARALYVGLLPHIQIPCLHDLSFYCSHDVSRGKELACLQDNYPKLSPPCKGVMFNFTRLQALDYKLDPALASSCARQIRSWCSDESGAERRDRKGEVLDCLIKYKDHPDMSLTCRAHVSHHQIVALENVHFSPTFWRACQAPARLHCPASHSKAAILKCLSGILLNDTLITAVTIPKRRLPRGCVKLLQAELFQMNEDIKLDPELELKCGAELKQYCANYSIDNPRVIGRNPEFNIECLRIHFDTLGASCRKVVFVRERESFAISAIDYSLYKACGKMIQRFCESSQDALACLIQNVESEFMDFGCKSLITRRRIEQTKDYRLNPALVKNCRADISKHCKKYIRTDDSPSILEENIIYCLRKKFVKKVLTVRCQSVMGKLVQESALDYRLDRELSSACGWEISRFCAPHQPEVQYGGPEIQDGRPHGELKVEGEMGPIDNGRVGECLRQHLVTGHIKSEPCRKEVIRILYESRGDIHLDPTLDLACHSDVPLHCSSIIPGEGRQMSCLLDVLHTSKGTLTPECRKLLSERVEMWAYAIKVAPPGSVAELAETLMTYRDKNYLLLSFGFALTILFILGWVMGRVTKRLRVDLKNR